MANDRVRAKGITIHRPIIYGNTAVVLTQKDREQLPSPDHTHRWTVAVRSAASLPDSTVVGGADDISYFVKRVTFKLHDTYANPTRNIDKPPFEVSETGWGEFEVQIRIHFLPDSGEKPIILYHHLKLHPWPSTASASASASAPTAPGAAPEREPDAPPHPDLALLHGPVHSWQYDELLFFDPFQSFFNLLLAHPPTALPKAKTRPAPFNGVLPALYEPAKGATPEFTAVMEAEEIERLEAAHKEVVAEHERWRVRLLEKEAELERLKRELSES